MHLKPEQITEIREANGFTRKGLSLELGMQEDAVRAWESGRRACKGPAALGLRLWARLRQTPEGQAIIEEEKAALK